MISGEEVVELLPGARRARADQRLPVLRLPDRRRAARADGARRGRALRRGVREPRRRDRACSSSDGRARGVRVARRRGRRARSTCAPANVVNATGVWADQLRPQELHDEAELPRIRPSRGTHITLRHEDLPLLGGAIVPAGGGRSIFALPWLGHTLVGTTDNDYEGPLEHIQPIRRRRRLPARRRQRASSARRSAAATLTGAFAGVRPLISTGDPKKSVDISRKAELYETSSGMITITGGKLTTWRRMAKMTVDRLVERDARDAPCRTHEIPLGQAIDVEELPRVEGVPGGLLPGARLALRLRRARRARARRRARRARPADRPGPARPARRGRARRAPRAGAQHRRRAAAPHAARAARRARADGRRRRATHAEPRRRTARRRASPTCSRASSAGTPHGAGASCRRSRPRRDAEGIVATIARARRSDGPRVAAVDAVNAPPRTLSARGLELELGTRPLLMGIVNASPDSFSDGGRHRGLDAQLALAGELLAAGADILDIGGESASTGRAPVAEQDEIERVVPLIERVAGELGALVSVDTYKPTVAARRDRRRREHRQRRQRPARSGAGRAVRRHRRGAGGDAHARRAARTPAGPRPLRRRHRRGARVPARAHRARAARRRSRRAADRRPRARTSPRRRRRRSACCATWSGCTSSGARC